MLVLDTNHLRELGYRSALGVRLRQRIEAVAEDVVFTVVSAEEMLKGRLARTAAARDRFCRTGGCRQGDDGVGAGGAVSLPEAVEIR